MILVCGEALVDLTPADCSGERGLVPRPGGSPYNVAVGLGRLGQPTGFLGGVSRDALGSLLWERLADSGVGTALLRRCDAPTPLALVRLDAEGAADYAFYLEGTALEQPPALAALPPQAQCVHIGSLALVSEPGASAFEELLRRGRGARLTSLDPNVRAPLIPDRGAYLRRLDRWLEASDVVKASDDDLAWLHPGEDPLEVAARWVAESCALAVVTHGRDGATAVGVEATARVRGEHVEVVDTVGAGDAFTAGLLCWLGEHDRLSPRAVRELDATALEDALRFAGRVAALACGRPGADPPWRVELGDLGGP